MKIVTKRVVAIVALLLCTQAAALGWHTRITNQTKYDLTVRLDIMAQQRQDFYIIKAHRTLDIQRGGMCLSGMKVWAGQKNKLKKAEASVRDSGYFDAALGVLDSYLGSFFLGSDPEHDTDNKKVEDEFKVLYEPKYTAKFSIPLSANRCQHWDFIITSERDDLGFYKQLKIQEQGHVLGGGPVFHPKGK